MKFNLRLLLFLVVLLNSFNSWSQTTITTVYSSGGLSSGSGGSGGMAAVFAIRNNNFNPVILSEVGYYAPAGTSYQWSLYMKPSPLTGPPGAISTANGWTQIAGPTLVPAPSTAGIITLLTNINHTIPANTTQRFAVVMESSTLINYYSSASPNIFSANGVDLLVGDNLIGTAAVVGYTGPITGPGFTPRFFLGKVTFAPAQPCSVATFPNSLMVFPYRDTVCANDTTTLRADTTLPLAQGLTYQWQSSTNPPLVAWANVGSAQQFVNYVATVPTSRWYRLRVLCNNSVILTSDSIRIHTIPSPPAPSPTGSSRCGPGTLNLSASVASPYTITWYNSPTSPLPVGIGANFTTPLIGTTTTYYAQSNSGGSAYNCASPRIPAIAEVRPIPNPNVNITVSPGDIVCLGTPVTFTATTSGGGTNPVYTWRRNGTIVGTNSPAFTASTLNTNDQIAVTLLSNADCAPAVPDTSNVIVMTVENPGTPTALISRTPAGTVCKGDAVTFKVSSVNKGPNPTYQWKVNGVNAGPAGPDTTFVLNNLNNGDQVQLVFNSSSPCATPATVNSNTLTIPVSTPVATITPASTLPLCEPDSMLLQANTGTGFSYQWYKDGVAIPAANAPNYYAIDSAYYSVRVTNNFGCDTLSAAVAVIIKPAPIANIPTPPSTFFCDSGAVVLTSAAGSINGHTYQWYRNGNPIFGATNWNFQADKSGTYTVLINRPNGCSALSNSVTLTTYTMPQANITQNGSQLSTMTGFAYYQWYMGATPINGANSSNFTAMQSGYYRVVVRDANGCERISNYVFVIGLGIHQTPLAKAIQVYPNPSSATLFVKAPKPISIRITDVQGRLVLKQDAQQIFQIDQLQAGLYMLQVFDENNQLIKVEKIEKR